MKASKLQESPGSLTKLFQIRQMRQEDLDTVYYIEKNTHRAPWSKEILHDCMLVGFDCRVLEIISFTQMQIIGYIICRHVLNSYHILNLCVAGSSQRQGYGKKLLTAVLDSLVGAPFDSVILEVRPSNKAAINLYEKFGFKEEGIKRVLSRSTG